MRLACDYSPHPRNLPKFPSCFQLAVLKRYYGGYTDLPAGSDTPTFP